MKCPVCERAEAKLFESVAGSDYWRCDTCLATFLELREAGHDVALYDAFFAPDQAVLHRRYDFVTCTETVEHFHDPAAEFRRFDTLLKPGGWLGIMTGMLSDGIDFRSWRYRRDPTHVVFYQRTTLRYLARQFGWRCEFPGQDVALMRKLG